MANKKEEDPCNVWIQIQIQISTMKTVMLLIKNGICGGKLNMLKYQYYEDSEAVDKERCLRR